MSEPSDRAEADAHDARQWVRLRDRARLMPLPGQAGEEAAYARAEPPRGRGDEWCLLFADSQRGAHERYLAMRAAVGRSSAADCVADRDDALSIATGDEAPRPPPIPSAPFLLRAELVRRYAPEPPGDALDDGELEALADFGAALFAGPWADDARAMLALRRRAVEAPPAPPAAPPQLAPDPPAAPADPPTRAWVPIVLLQGPAFSAMGRPWASGPDAEGRWDVVWARDPAHAADRLAGGPDLRVGPLDVLVRFRAGPPGDSMDDATLEALAAQGAHMGDSAAAAAAAALLDARARGTAAGPAAPPLSVEGARRWLDDAIAREAERAAVALALRGRQVEELQRQLDAERARADRLAGELADLRRVLAGLGTAGAV